MSQLVKKVRTSVGDLPIDYNALANLPPTDTTLTKSGGLAEAKTTGDKINSLRRDLSVERSRIDSFVSLPDGATTSDAELQDIRVGYNGNVYDTAGNAVRGQFIDLSECKVDIDGVSQVSVQNTDFLTYEDLMSQENITNVVITSVGSVQNNTSYQTSDFILVNSGDKIFIPGYMRYIAYYNINKVSLSSTYPVLEYQYNVNLTIPEHVCYIRISWVVNPETTIPQYIRNSKDINIFKLGDIIAKGNYVFPDGSINFSSLRDVPNIIADDKNVYLRWQNDVSQKILLILMKCSDTDSYLGYHFQHSTKEYDSTNTSSNYDIWRLRGVYIYSKNGEDFKQTYTDTLVHKDSEWECAIKETGLLDFSGGTTHGDEFITDICFMCDGVVYTDVTHMPKHCIEFRIIRRSNLFRAETNSETKIATHYVDYLFKDSQIVIDNRIDWLVDTSCGISYMSMLGARRLNDGMQITNKGIKQGDGAILDLSTEGHINNTPTKHCKKAYIWNDGTNGGLKTYMSMELLDSDDFENANFKFDNKLNYNKFYFDHCGQDFNVSTGDIWHEKTLIKIDYFGIY